METEPDTTKISISVYPALLMRFKKSLGQVLKRDAFLNQLIAQELPYMRAELAGMRNSDAAKKHIARELRKLKPETINVVLEKSVASELNKVVEEANLVRDSVLNFLLFCLDPTRGFFKEFELPEYYTFSAFRTSAEPPSLRAMLTISQTLADPFYYLRLGTMERWKCGLYALELPPPMHGLTCFLPDTSVPGTKAFKQQQKEVEALLKELEELDAKAFPGKQGVTP